MIDTFPMPPDAFIFDMDDLLMATADVWRQAEEALFRAIDQPRTEALLLKYKGMNALDVARVIHRELRPALPLEQCQTIMRDALIDAFARDVSPMPGAVDLVRALSGRRPMAVASGSPVQAIRLALDRQQMMDCFNVILSSEAVARGKPAPDVFLLAANQLGVPAGRCLVFEDSLPGVCAAKAASMACLAVPSSNREQIEPLADLVYNSLADINAGTLVGVTPGSGMIPPGKK